MAPITESSLNHSGFNLDASGVAGFFGGDEAISAMATVHLFKGRRWLGWYNSPGSYTIGKCYGRLANNRWWDGLFPGANDTPAQMFKLDGRKGPRYFGTRSGTKMRTGHLGYLFLEKCKEEKIHSYHGGDHTTTPTNISIVHLDEDPHNDVPIRPIGNALLGLIPIFVSGLTALFCFLSEDGWGGAMIVLGMVAGGVSCFVIGSGEVKLHYVKNPAQGVPPGDGLLIGDGSDMAIVKGAEKVVNVLTKGRFEIDIGGGPEYRAIGFSAMLLVAQFLLQLLLIPQASLFGQIMFVISLAVSWGYTSFLSSIEKEKIQSEILWKALHTPKVRKYSLKSRSAAATFVALVLSPPKPEKVLKEFIPNDTAVWNKWRDVVSAKIKANEALKFSDTESCGVIEEFGDDDERTLYKSLLAIAADAYQGYLLYQADVELEKARRPPQPKRKSTLWSILSFNAHDSKEVSDPEKADMT
ncbi:hypothetical protein CONPUDRAFT_139737 [Coniophora puteana RWD-64-598 SS2]|uniref:Uncharacterized protein n=1 Tax=Coniophora puteana (strain RWD-64-598) TaxID=741705 RepID=A0A5M3MCJ1_CONPW|nr:uncharacterized protein CONPUDRAFT_139737 [Coniophora puteana RWD-64-598 SS2]EIW76355.1 hypothetical protein CONPUDRAFT_139737 [Coniophora puteana RWD-64-598 SS2]